MLKIDDLSMKMQMSGCIQVAFLWERWSLGFMWTRLQFKTFPSDQKRKEASIIPVINWTDMWQIFYKKIISNQKITITTKVKITVKTAAGCFCLIIVVKYDAAEMEGPQMCWAMIQTPGTGEIWWF